MSYDQINGPSYYGNLAVSTTPVLLKVGSSAYTERIEVIFRPIDGTVYLGFDASVSSTTGIPIYKGEFVRMESGALETIYLVTASGTVNVRIGERG